MDRKEVVAKATQLLLQVGIPVHLKGYAYVRSAIVMVSYDIRCIHCITKTVYPAIAEEYNVSKWNAERNIRYAIEEGWKRGNPQVLEDLFGYTIDADCARPTNTEFIAMMAYKIRDELN